MLQLEHPHLPTKDSDELIANSTAQQNADLNSTLQEHSIPESKGKSIAFFVNPSVYYIVCIPTEWHLLTIKSTSLEEWSGEEFQFHAKNF